MTDAPKTVSDGIANKPAEAPVSAADDSSRLLHAASSAIPKSAAEALPSEQTPAATT